MECLWDGGFAETFLGSQSQIVYILFQDGELRMSVIAGRLDLTAGAVTTAAGHLIDGGYVERVLSDSDTADCLRVDGCHLLPFSFFIERR